MGGFWSCAKKKKLVCFSKTKTKPPNKIIMQSFNLLLKPPTLKKILFANIHQQWSLSLSCQPSSKEKRKVHPFSACSRPNHEIAPKWCQERKCHLYQVSHYIFSQRLELFTEHGTMEHGISKVAGCVLKRFLCPSASPKNLRGNHWFQRRVLFFCPLFLPDCQTHYF